MNIDDSTQSGAIASQQQVEQYLIKGDYAKAARFYEEAISTEPNNKSNYWYLGLILLLQEQEIEAQTTWLLAIAEGTPEQVEIWTAELIGVLENEAKRREALVDYSVTWAIRQHIRELNPTEINNLLHLIVASLELKNYTGDEPTELGVVELLKTEPPVDVDRDLLFRTLQQVLKVAAWHSASLELTRACKAYVDRPLAFADSLLPVVYNLAYLGKDQPLALLYSEIGLEVAPQHIELLRAVASFHTEVGEFSKGAEYAKICYSLSEKLVDKIYDNHSILRSLMMGGGCGQDVDSFVQRQEVLLESLIDRPPTGLGAGAENLRLYNSTFYLAYFEDNPQKYVKLRSQVSEVCQVNFEAGCQEEIERYRQRISQSLDTTLKPLKIGYLSHCLRRHSVGWLTRWLFKYHNRDRFQVFAYLLASKEEQDSLLEWYVRNSHKAYKYGLAGKEVAEQISEDEIDILVDLDSITLNASCAVMAAKAAPIQVTWLGWDVSGIPTIDYFIADPYVLPEDAQSYYREKIWRLPQSYIAVDGFEVGVPSLCRENLNVPADGVVYFSAQKGPKYNQQTVKLQMQILKAVPNSYFLIKGFGEYELLQKLLFEMAEKEGVESDRFRFLPRDPSEEIYRANLGIADIVLDTYPYNGATTTMETLWMGIPMVTRVGQQFAARNSYTMMVNAGITEGIAWTDEEYVEWGIRLGKDERLRQEISWKLRKSRQTAPLWNGKQFTREMEKAYEEMWQRYIEGGS